MKVLISIVSMGLLLGSMAVLAAEPREIPLWPQGVPEVRSRAAEYQLDPKKIALLGFSAGGQTALVAAANPPRFGDNAPGTSDWPNRALDWLRGRGL
jgi:hypothetical protein